MHFCSKVMTLPGKLPKSTRMPCSTFRFWNSSSLTSKVCRKNRSSSLDRCILRICRNSPFDAPLLYYCHLWLNYGKLLTLELWLFLLTPLKIRTVSSIVCSSRSCCLTRTGIAFQYSVEAVWTSKLSQDLVLLSITRGIVLFPVQLSNMCKLNFSLASQGQRRT